MTMKSITSANPCASPAACAVPTLGSLVVGVLLALSLAACHESGATPCKSGTSCGEGKVCVASQCTTACLADTDCDKAQTCREGGCVLDNPQCGADADCASACGAKAPLCTGGKCQCVSLELGAMCTTDQSCSTVHCGCTAADCSKKACAPSICVCSVASATGCGASLADGVPQPGVCDGDHACYGGQCALAVGSSCARDGDCGTQHCGCQNATCTARACTAATCTCAIASQQGCGAPLTDGVQQAGVCDGASACYGGSCLAGYGSSCLAHAECGSGHCECADAGCTQRTCAAQACVCGYGSSCLSALPDRATDPQDCDGLGVACFGGQCEPVLGQTCQADMDCGGMGLRCGCAAADCATRVCTGTNCPCGYVTGDACTGLLTDGTAAPGQCDGSAACFAGACKLTLGQWCQQSSECGSGYCWANACATNVCTGAALTATFAGGSGTSADPYVVCTADQLARMGTTFDGTGQLTASYVLAADLDLAGIAFVPIGTDAKPFLGALDGKGHTIDHLTVNDTTAGHFVGLFGALGFAGSAASSPVPASIQNLSVVNVHIVGSNGAGAVAGKATANILSVTTSGTVAADTNAGGLVGDADGGGANVWIEMCSSSAAVSVTTSHGGGLVGHSILVNYTHNHATGSVNGGAYVGGMFGEHLGYLQKARASGAVSGTDHVGGLVGASWSGIGNSYATGAVTGTGYVGGLVGVQSGSKTLYQCYASGTVTGATGSRFGGLIGSTDDPNSHSRKSVDASFAVGPVRLGVGATLGGALIGMLGTYQVTTPGDTPNVVTGSAYYLDPTGTVTACLGDTQSDGCQSVPSVAALYDATHPLYTSWNFTSVWQAHPDGLPTFR